MLARARSRSQISCEVPRFASLCLVRPSAGDVGYQLTIAVTRLGVRCVFKERFNYFGVDPRVDLPINGVNPLLEALERRHPSLEKALAGSALCSAEVVALAKEQVEQGSLLCDAGLAHEFERGAWSEGNEIDRLPSSERFRSRSWAWVAQRVRRLAGARVAHQLRRVCGCSGRQCRCSSRRTRCRSADRRVRFKTLDGSAMTHATKVFPIPTGSATRNRRAGSGSS